MSTGWVLTKEDVERDVERLLGGAYIEFMEKDLRVAKEWIYVTCHEESTRGEATVGTYMYYVLFLHVNHHTTTLN